ncbi:unnamed protein product, partial [Ectocarpus fasciculatus]
NKLSIVPVQSGNSSDDSTARPKADTLPPVWVDKIEMVEADIGKIQSRSTSNYYIFTVYSFYSLFVWLWCVAVRDLNGLHSKRLMVNFESDEATQERNIDVCTQEITDLFRHSELLLKQFGKLGDEKKISAQERTVRHNMQTSIAKRLQGLSMTFRSSQKDYLNRLQSQKTGNGAQNFAFLESKRGPDLDPGFTAMQEQILDETEAMVNQRDEEITNIAKSIEELAQIFKELAVLVIDQGTILDRIDYNMEQVLENTKEGLVQLHKAEDYQKSALPLKCVIVLVLLIFIMLGAMIMKHTVFKKK